MKILFTRFPLESAYGGAEVQTMALAKGLQARGHAVAFLGSCPILLRLFREAGFPAAELDIGPPPVSPATALSFAWRRPRMRRRLLSALRRFSHLDAVCMLSLSEKLLLTREAAERGAKVLWIEHDRVGRWLESNPWKKELLRASARARIIAVSGLSAGIYERLGFPRERITAVANGIDAARFSAVRPAPSGGAPRIGCIARLSPEKGIDVLLRALAEMPDAAGEILGRGPLEQDLRSLARKLGEEERVTFRTQESDVPDALSRMDVLVLPSSDHDPFGLVAAEAMAAGVPVIVTDACGIAAYLEDGTEALVAQAGSVASLADCLRRMRSPELRERLGREGRRAARERFSLDRMVDEYERLLGS